MTVADPEIAFLVADEERHRGVILGGRTRYILGKVLGSLSSLVFVLVFNFFLFRVLPGDPAKDLTRNRYVPASQVAAITKRFGLDKPLPQQFVDYVKSTLHGDLGISYQYQQPVTHLIGQRIWATVALVGLSTVLSTVIGLWFGIRRCVGPRRAVRQDHDGLQPHALRDAGVLARPAAARRVRRRGRPVPRHLPDRR